MNFGYDSWNRIMGMTYPDGEVVTYDYNLGGMLKSISGTKMNNAYPYIDSIRYNEFELKEAVYYGNGTKTFYKYDILQRLINLQSYTATTATPSELMQNIDYTYDAVSNITDIDNSAGILANGLGGKYHDRHTYDNLYRLVYSKGNWLGSPNTNYELEMSYNLNGRIGRKTLTAGIVTQTPMTNSFNSVGYDNSYHYANTSQPNTLTYIDNNGPQQFFKWDAKGNMTYHKNTAVSLERFLCWDEQNRLQGVRDKSSLSVYQYDANGDRTYKLTGDYTYQNVSGTWRYFYQLDNATLYASPYLVVTPKGYTKHYYAESERIASKLGNGGLQELGHPLADDIQVHDKLFANKNHAQSVIYECLNAEEVRAFSPLSYLYELTSSSQSPEDKRYFYHPDHLGSSSWITFTDGEAVQHLHYLPYGEDLVNQQHTVVGAMYTFSAKEKDAETGYSYFGSRYYSSDLSIWLSVDPMADKYPMFSPYVYCANNPVKLVDPNGEDVIVVIWCTNDNTVGHAGIAVSNYKSEKYTEYENGKPIEKTRYVPDGTYTYYDNWPSEGVKCTPIGAMRTVPADRNVITINSIDEFTNGSSFCPGEDTGPDAVLQLNTSYEQDLATQSALDNANIEKPNYNAATYNCSSYVSDGLSALFGEKIGKEKVLGPIKAITPNQLWKDTMSKANSLSIPFFVLKSPGNDIANKFTATMKGGKK